MLRYFPEESDTLLVMNLDQLRRIRGVQSVSGSMQKMLLEVSPEYKEASDAMPISAIDQLSTAEIFVEDGESHRVTAVVLNRPLPELMKAYDEKIKELKDAKFSIEADPEDSRVFISKFDGEVLEYMYVLGPKELISFTPGIKTQMLKRVKATFLKDSIYSNKALQDIKKLETRQEIVWGLGFDQTNKDVDKFYLSVDAVNGQIVTEVNVGFKEIEVADKIFRQADQMQKFIVEGTAKTPYAKFFQGDWLEFDVHSGTFKVKVSFSENLLAKHLPKAAKELDSLSMRDVQKWIAQSQKKQARAEKKKKK